jgi:hypothetical protein
MAEGNGTGIGQWKCQFQDMMSHRAEKVGQIAGTIIRGLFLEHDERSELSDLRFARREQWPVIGCD